jgi:outer membrane protein assembly factor BamB
MPPTRDPNPTPAWKDVLSAVLAATVAVAAIFSIAVAVFLAANYLHGREIDPLTNSALQYLKEAAARHPNDDALKESYRALDTQTRQVFYTTQAFSRRGAWMLAGGMLVLLISANLLAVINRWRPAPGTADEEELNRQRKLLRFGVLAGCAALAVLTVSLVMNSEKRLAELAGAETPPTPDPDKAAQTMPTLEELNAQWPAFRGYGNTGVTSVAEIPTQWDGAQGTAVLWKATPPKHGFSSPVVWHDTVFLTGADRQSRDLYCFDAKSGTLKWTVTTEGIVGSPEQLPDVAEDTGYAAPTPATDGKRVYAIFATGDIMAVDFGGKRVWGRNLGLPDNPYGHASSLVTYQGRVLVQFDHFAGARLICLDGETGDTLWERERDVSASWASPLLVADAARPEIILNAEPAVMAYNPLDGALLWSCECMGGEVGPSPAYTSGLSFATTDYAVLAAIRTGGTATDGTVVWDTGEELPDVASPVASGNLLFVATSIGILSCYNAATGDLHWRREFPDGFYSSPIVAGDKLLLTDMPGVTRIIRAADAYEEIAVCPLGERVVATPAVVKNRLYIRGVANLYAIGAP